MIAAYIDEIIMFCAGLWMTSVVSDTCSYPVTRRPGRLG